MPNSVATLVPITVQSYTGADGCAAANRRAPLLCASTPEIPAPLCRERRVRRRTGRTLAYPCMTSWRRAVLQNRDPEDGRTFARNRQSPQQAGGSVIASKIEFAGCLVDQSEL